MPLCTTAKVFELSSWGCTFFSEGFPCVAQRVWAIPKFAVISYALLILFTPVVLFIFVALLFLSILIVLRFLYIGLAFNFTCILSSELTINFSWIFSCNFSTFPLVFITSIFSSLFLLIIAIPAESYPLYSSEMSPFIRTGTAFSFPI